MPVLIFSPNGAYTHKSTLAEAATAPDAAGKTIHVTSPQVVTTAIAWPADRELVFDKGGYVTFTGAGALTGLKEARPEWFGAKGDGVTDDSASVILADSMCDLKVASKNYYCASNVTLTGTWKNNGGKFTIPTTATITLNCYIDSGNVQMFDITPNWVTTDVANTTVDIVKVGNISGFVKNAYGMPEWFGAVPYVTGAVVDSYAALVMTMQVGNTQLNAIYIISKSLLLQNNRSVKGAGSRPTIYGFLISPQELPFTGNYGVYNFEYTGMTSISAANGTNQNPYVYCEGFTVYIKGMDSASFVGYDIYMWETSKQTRLKISVDAYGAVTTSRLKTVARFGGGPSEVSILDIFGTGFCNCTGDYSVEFWDMTNMNVDAVNLYISANKPAYFDASIEAPSKVTTTNFERHPSVYTAVDPVTTPSIVATGPVNFDSCKLSTSALSSMGFMIIYDIAIPWTSNPTITNTGTAKHPAATIGTFSTPILFREVNSLVPDRAYNATYLFNPGFVQSASSLFGISSFNGFDAKFYGGEKTLANAINSEATYNKSIGSMTAASTFVIPFPPMIRMDSMDLVLGILQVGGRNGGGAVDYYATFYIEGDGTSAGRLRLTEISGAASWSLAVDRTARTFTLTNTSASSSTDVVISMKLKSSVIY